MSAGKLRLYAKRSGGAPPFGGLRYGAKQITNTEAKQENTVSGKCPKCDAESHVLIEYFRARDEGSKRTVPAVQFICEQCRTILGIALDPEWQAQVVAGQLRTVGASEQTSH